MTFKLVAKRCRWNGRAELQTTVTLLDKSESPLFEDSVNLSKQSSRYRFAQTLQKRFPNLKGKDIESQLLKLLWQTESQQEEAEEEAAAKEVPGRESQADKLVRLVEENRLKLFHTPTETAYARIPVEGHAKIYRCRSQTFKQWLSRQLYLTEGKTPNSDALNSAIITIEGKAIFDGEEYQLHNRVTFHEEAIWYDLADDAWRAVKITSDGWEVVNHPPILFSRYRHQNPQVEPTHQGDLRRLIDFVNLKGETDELLFMVYVTSCFVPDIPHPILHPFGEKGAAKTTLFKLVGSLVDPSAEELLIVPHDSSELAQKLNHHWVCYFDNLSSLPDWVSDMLSRAATGIGFGKRELYTDEGDIIWKIKRVIGLNGINVVATKPDLLDRCILLELERIPDECRREERQLLADFEQAQSAILGGLFDVLSTAMRIYPKMTLQRLPRMADFARWGAAIAEAFGYQASDFLEAYSTNVRSQNVEVLSSNAIASTLLAFMEDKDSYEGTPAELLDELTQKAEQLKIRTNMRSWPGAPQSLSYRLNELRSNLREGGIEVVIGKGGRVKGEWKRLIRVAKIENTVYPKSSENTVVTVAPLHSDRIPYPEKCNGIDGSTVADGETPLQNQCGRNGAEAKRNDAHKTPLQSEQPCSQIQPQRCNDSNDKLHTLLAEGESVILESLGMTKEQAIAIWDKQGRPVIHLGPGENCQDLVKLLEQRDIKPEHLSAIREWLG